MSFCCTCLQKGLLRINIHYSYLEKVKTMRRNIDSLKFDNEDYPPRETHDGFTCGTCGEIFQKPLLATVTSNGSARTYLACPRCMVKVGNIKTEKRSIIDTSEKKGITHDKNSQCKHFLGYLKKRSRDMPIPDECLTCGKMIECTVR